MFVSPFCLLSSQENPALRLRPSFKALTVAMSHQVIALSALCAMSEPTQPEQPMVR
jgi:hypothetical protein